MSAIAGLLGTGTRQLEVSAKAPSALPPGSSGTGKVSVRLDSRIFLGFNNNLDFS